MDNFDLALAEQAEQGSGVWHNARVGRFTASENHRLMKSGYREMTPEELKARPKSGKGSSAKLIEDLTVISDDTMTYITEKVAETLTGEPKAEVFSHATAWGDTWEPWAAEFYAKAKGVELEIIGFIPFGDHAGGSIDRGILGKDEFLEIKNPYNPKNQIDYLMLTDQFDLKRMYPNHYWQIVSNVLFSKKPLCHFATFDPRMKLDKHKMMVIDVIPPPEDLELMAKKLEVAEKEKQKILQLLK
jgi:hypothetical protein